MSVSKRMEFLGSDKTEDILCDDMSGGKQSSHNHGTLLVSLQESQLEPQTEDITFQTEDARTSLPNPPNKPGPVCKIENYTDATGSIKRKRTIMLESSGELPLKMGRKTEDLLNGPLKSDIQWMESYLNMLNNVCLPVTTEEMNARVYAYKEQENLIKPMNNIVLSTESYPASNTNGRVNTPKFVPSLETPIHEHPEPSVTQISTSFESSSINRVKAEEGVRLSGIND